MSLWMGTWAEVRAAAARLGLPLSDDELDTVWAMAQDLSRQAEQVRRALDHLAEAGWPPVPPSPAPPAR